MAPSADSTATANPETERWHCVDIPLDAARYDAARDCQNIPGQGDCVIAAIDRFTTVLRDPSRPADERSEALKFLIHFVADVHCLLHAEDDGDRGGTRLQVTFLDQPTNLHSVWHSRLIRQAGFNTTSLTEAVEKLTTQVPPDGTPIEWAKETHDIARDVAYRIPPDHVLGKDYLQRAMAVLERQLLRGGARLA